MLDQSLFSTHEIQQHEIELQDGTKHVFNFKHLSAADHTITLGGFVSENVETRANVITRAIAKSLCDDDGKQIITIEQAASLKPEVFNRLWDTVFTMNFNLKAANEDEGEEAEAKN
jgi:hypothetical protein